MCCGCAGDCIGGMLRCGNSNESSVSSYDLVCFLILGCGGGVEDIGAGGKKSRLIEKPYSCPGRVAQLVRMSSSLLV